MRSANVKPPLLNTPENAYYFDAFTRTDAGEPRTPASPYTVPAKQAISRALLLFLPACQLSLAGSSLGFPVFGNKLQQPRSSNG